MEFIKNTIRDEIKNITIIVLATEKLTPKQTATAVKHLIRTRKLKRPKKGQSITVTYTGPVNFLG